MTIIKTPFGEYDTDTGKLVISPQMVDTPEKPKPAVPDPLSLIYNDPSVASREEARSDLEALRFTQLRRLYVQVNGVCLAHRFWESRTRLEPWEQQSLADDRARLGRFVLPSSGENRVELSEAGPNVTEDDVRAIAKAAAHRRVYWKGAEVTV